MVNWSVIWTHATRIRPAGCDSSAAHVTRTNRICTPSSTVVISTTALSEIYQLARNCWYGMMTSTNTIWVSLLTYKTWPQSIRMVSPSWLCYVRTLLMACYKKNQNPLLLRTSRGGGHWMPMQNPVERALFCRFALGNPCEGAITKSMSSIGRFGFKKKNIMWDMFMLWCSIVRCDTEFWSTFWMWCKWHIVCSVRVVLCIVFVSFYFLSTVCCMSKMVVFVCGLPVVRVVWWFLSLSLP